MLTRLKKNNSEGFTIIEVMIVLAIAGLIILIVLLAVPALQRNARNTSLKNDASAVAAGVSEFKSNNDGAAPSGANPITTTTIQGGAGTAPVTIKLSSGATITNVNNPAQGNMGYIIGKNCASVVNTRSVQIWYTPESSTPVPKCIDA